MGKVVEFPQSTICSNQNKPLTVLDVANTFLAIESMTRTKLHMLCYYAQAWHLALNENPFFKAEFEAGSYGPICRKLHKHFSYNEKQYELIPQRITIPSNISKTSYEYAFIYSIFEKYGHLTGPQLRTLAQNEWPYRSARNYGSSYLLKRNSRVISTEVMRDFYKQ